MLGNRPEYLWLWFGIGSRRDRRGAAQHGRSRRHARAHAEHDRSAQLVIDAQWLERVERIAPRLESLERVVVVGDGRVDAFDCVPYAALLDASAARPPAVATPRDPSVILFTPAPPGRRRASSSATTRTSGSRQTRRADGLRRRRGALQHVPALPRQRQLHDRAAGDADVDRGSCVLHDRFSASRFWDICRAEGVPPSTSWARCVMMLFKQPEATTTRTTRCAAPMGHRRRSRARALRAALRRAS